MDNQQKKILIVEDDQFLREFYQELLQGEGRGTTFTVSLPIATQDKIEHANEYAIKPKEGEAKPLEAVAI